MIGVCLKGEWCENSLFLLPAFNPWTGAPLRLPTPQGLLPRPAVSAPCSPEANVGRIQVFLRMLSHNWQRTFDGASPRLVQPTLASGEHGADTAGRGNRPCGVGNRRGAPVQGSRLVVKGNLVYRSHRPGVKAVCERKICLQESPFRVEADREGKSYKSHRPGGGLSNDCPWLMMVV
jgi:hypothetical protein